MTACHMHVHAIWVAITGCRQPPALTAQEEDACDDDSDMDSVMGARRCRRTFEVDACGTCTSYLISPVPHLSGG